MKGGNKLNERIKILRKRLDLTQQEFGERIGIKRNSVALIENGRNTSEQTIFAICREFNVNEEWLRFGIGDMYKPEPKIDELAYLMGMFISNNDESTTRAKIIKAMLSLDDDGWKFIEGLVERIAK